MADDDYLAPRETTVTIVAPTPEQAELLGVFAEMLKAVSADGGRKRSAGTKPPWWRDPSHEAAMYRHLDRYEAGEKHDPDHEAHPLVAAAWRALAIAYQETHGRVEPNV